MAAAEAKRDLNRRLKTKVPAAEMPSSGQLMTLAVSVVVIAALYLAKEVLVPITLAVLLSFVLAPLVRLLRRWGVWRVPAVGLAVLVALGVILALGGVIGVQVAALGRHAGAYAEVIGTKVDAIRQFAAAESDALSARLGRSMDPAPKPAPAAPNQPAPPVAVEVHQPAATPMQMLERAAVPVLSPLASLGIVLVVAVFILMQMEDLRDRLIRLFGSADLHRTTAALDDAAERLSRYFLTQLGINAAFGAVIAVGLYFLGVPSPFLFGILSALLRFVPYVGPFAAVVLPAALAAAVDPGWTLVVETLGLFAVVELVTGQAVEPLLYGHSTGLSPVSVVVAAIFWAWLWGPVGLLLSMPLTLCLVVLGRHVERLQFIDVLLGDRPALTPAESFYQRILAGDADEALDQAEVLLKETTLPAYYDTVALGGLHMAANDSVRGVLTDEQLENIREVVSAVVADLDGHRVAAAGGAGEGVVLCVSGRGPLDEAACTMVAQVLGHAGVASRVVGEEAVARGAIGALDLAGVRAICVSYLEVSGSLSGLRYLLRRLRERAPGVKLVVGLWQGEAVIGDGERLRGVMGEAVYAPTLEGAVAACLS